MSTRLLTLSLGRPTLINCKVEFLRQFELMSVNVIWINVLLVEFIWVLGWNTEHFIYLTLIIFVILIEVAILQVNHLIKALVWSHITRPQEAFHVFLFQKEVVYAFFCVLFSVWGSRSWTTWPFSMEFLHFVWSYNTRIALKDFTLQHKVDPFN